MSENPVAKFPQRRIADLAPHTFMHKNIEPLNYVLSTVIYA